MGKKFLYKIAFRSCIVQFYTTSVFYYSIFDDLKKKQKTHHNKQLNNVSDLIYANKQQIVYHEL